MLTGKRGKTPQVDRSACVAPAVMVCAAVRFGADARIPFGAVLTAEDGEMRVGDRAVVMENAPREVVADLDGDREFCGDLPG